jgi:hypothetical protein
MLNANARRWLVLLRMWWLARRVKSAMQELQTMRDTAEWLQEQSTLHQTCITTWCAEITRLERSITTTPTPEAQHAPNL